MAGGDGEAVRSLYHLVGDYMSEFFTGSQPHEAKKKAGGGAEVHDIKSISLNSFAKSFFA